MLQFIHLIWNSSFNIHLWCHQGLYSSTSIALSWKQPSLVPTTIFSFLSAETCICYPSRTIGRREHNRRRWGKIQIFSGRDVCGNSKCMVLFRFLISCLYDSIQHSSLNPNSTLICYKVISCPPLISMQTYPHVFKVEYVRYFTLSIWHTPSNYFMQTGKHHSI